MKKSTLGICLVLSALVGFSSFLSADVKLKARVVGKAYYKQPILIRVGEKNASVLRQGKLVVERSAGLVYSASLEKPKWKQKLTIELIDGKSKFYAKTLDKQKASTDYDITIKDKRRRKRFPQKTIKFQVHSPKKKQRRQAKKRIRVIEHSVDVATEHGIEKQTIQLHFQK